MTVQDTPTPKTMLRQEARQRLLEAGLLTTKWKAPAEARRLTIEERMSLGRLSPGSLTSEAIIAEDRQRG